jgi:membrane protease YdiL (CAAX protease family)
MSICLRMPANEKVSLAILPFAAIILIGLQQLVIGWSLLIFGIVFSAPWKSISAKTILIIFLGLAILGITPISTDISYQHMVLMGTQMLIAILLPTLLARKFLKKSPIIFPLYHGKKWSRGELFYIGLVIVLGYLIIPFYLKDSQAYLNWSVEPDWHHIIRLFIGTNVLGIWDELFFICIVLSMLQTLLPFKLANLIQATMFTSFLFELGFTGWGPLIIFPFALLQGVVFKKTTSLISLLIIHLSLDLILFLALINSHIPKWLNIFIINNL